MLAMGDKGRGDVDREEYSVISPVSQETMALGFSSSSELRSETIGATNHSVGSGRRRPKQAPRARGLHDVSRNGGPLSIPCPIRSVPRRSSSTQRLHRVNIMNGNDSRIASHHVLPEMPDALEAGQLAGVAQSGGLRSAHRYLSPLESAALRRMSLMMPW